MIFIIGSNAHFTFTNKVYNFISGNETSFRVWDAYDTIGRRLVS